MKLPTRMYHGGLTFALWTSDGAWFWNLTHPRHSGGIVGAASTEAEAMREARTAIEELATRARRDSTCAGWHSQFTQ